MPATQVARLSVAEHAMFLLQPPHSAREAFADAGASIERGEFLCLNQSVALQLAHNTYVPHPTAVEILPALRAASGQRAEVA